ncbi:MAG TPA: MBL fold metallo-hydrolase, partial [Bacillota bacterium]
MTAPAEGLSTVAEEIRLLDLVQGGRPGRFSGYLLTAPRPAVIEPGSKRDVSRWLETLEGIDFPRDEVAYVVVTHVHLDHAGGAGTLLRELPSARLVVHTAGARHLVDPTRLTEGSRAVFGERLDRYFGVPDPAPADRVQAVDDGQILDLGAGRRLRFLEGRGHARHQHMILDEGTGLLFSGDELGVRYLPACGDGRDYVLPSTVPNQFDP